MQPLTVKEPGTLFDFLEKALHGAKRSTIKNYLRFGSVFVNGKSLTQHDHRLAPGDKVLIETDKKQALISQNKSWLDIVYEDSAIIVINKPAGLLTIATEKEQRKTAYHQVHEYLKHVTALKSGRANAKPVYIVHRLDKEASGLLILAKTLAAKVKLQEEWADFEKRYFAVVDGVPDEPEGTLKSYLKENQFLRIYATDRKSDDAKFAVTHYKVLKPKPPYCLLEVTLETGRKHQIRVHLSEMKHPIVGDPYYGKKPDPIKRLALHGYFLSVRHPEDGKWMTFKTEIPDTFKKLIGGN